MIYCEILVASDLVRPRVFVPRRGTSFIIPGYEVTVGIDASILRSCRLASKEATWILYQLNEIVFTNAEEIEDFRSGGLPMGSVVAEQERNVELQPFYHSRFNPNGRLAMLGKLHFMFKDFLEWPGLDSDELSAAPRPTRASITHAWSRLLVRNPDTSPSERLSFPALRELGLDFRYFNLQENEGVAVC